MISVVPELPPPELTARISIEQVEAFAVASGDHNPIHLSVDAARAAGLEGPVLHGMIVAGRLEAFLEKIDTHCISELQVRFVRPVPVGRSLAISARALDLTGSQIHLRLLASLEGGGLVAIAEARLAPTSRPA